MRSWQCVLQGTLSDSFLFAHPGKSPLAGEWPRVFGEQCCAVDPVSLGEACFLDIMQFILPQVTKPQENLFSMPAFMTFDLNQCTDNLQACGSCNANTEMNFFPSISISALRALCEPGGWLDTL